MSACIYVEGGGCGPIEGRSSKHLTIACQRAFHKLLQKMGVKRQPRLVPSGGRKQVYDRFRTAHANGEHAYIGMWIDAEEPMADVEKAWKHLTEVKTVPAWAKPKGATDDQVLFMTTSMETWIVVDRAALRRHYKQQLNENPLPSVANVEGKTRESVYRALVTATKNCSNAYAKGERSSEVLEELDPAVLRKHLPSFVRIERILKKKL